MVTTTSMEINEKIMVMIITGNFKRFQSPHLCLQNREVFSGLRKELIQNANKLFICANQISNKLKVYYKKRSS